MLLMSFNSGFKYNLDHSQDDEAELAKMNTL
jgi:hypothetical protein